jgi:hypothetical protein
MPSNLKLEIAILIVDDILVHGRTKQEHSQLL